MIRTSIAAAALAQLCLALAAAVTPAAAEPNHAPSAAAAPQANSKLMIVDGHSGRVVYDDGYNDDFCVIRRHTVGFDDYGRRILRRRLVCR